MVATAAMLDPAAHLAATSESAAMSQHRGTPAPAITIADRGGVCEQAQHQGGHVVARGFH